MGISNLKAQGICQDRVILTGVISRITGQGLPILHVANSMTKRLRKLKYVDDEATSVGCTSKCVCKGGEGKCDKDECDCVITDGDCQCGYSPLEYSYSHCPGFIAVVCHSH